jgi:hypothetical protein
VKEKTIKAELKDKEDNLKILNAYFNKENFSSEENINEINLFVKILNLGEESQSDITLNVKSLNERFEFSKKIIIDLDPQESITENFVVNLPENLNIGEYKFEISAFNENSSLETEIVSFNIFENNADTEENNDDSTSTDNYETEDDKNNNLTDQPKDDEANDDVVDYKQENEQKDTKTTSMKVISDDQNSFEELNYERGQKSLKDNPKELIEIIISALALLTGIGILTTMIIAHGTSISSTIHPRAKQKKLSFQELKDELLRNGNKD